jgi:type IV pilus assembly protein PilF
MKRYMGLILIAVFLSGCATSREPDERSRNIARIHTELAGAYFGRQQYAVALQEVGVAMRADATYAPIYNVSGMIRMALGEDDKAKADFMRGLKLDPGSSETHNNYGWFLCQRGRAQDSLQQFQEALKNPLYATPEIAYANAGICARKAGDFQMAESYLNRALILRPGMPEALFGFADLKFASAEYANAKKYFHRFQQSTQDMTAEQLLLAVRIERKMQDRNSEASYALQLMKRFPDSREAQLVQRGE